MGKKLTEDQRQFMKLVMRSDDVGEGWRWVSDMCWPLVERFSMPELIEVNAEEHKVRLTEKATIVMEYV